MRIAYHHDLRQLTELLRAICLRIRTAIETATHALMRADLEQSEQAIDIGRDVEAMRSECEHEAIRLLALQTPVASELRQVVTVLRLLGNLDRMSVLATHIAELARRRHPAAVVPDTVRPLIERMGAAAVSIATAAAAVLDTGDREVAAGLDRQDDIMDNLHEELLGSVLDPSWAHGITAAVDMTLLGRYYERFADNAVELGRRTLFVTAPRD